MKQHILCASDELIAGTGRVFEIGNRSIGIFNINEKYYALRNRCPHQGGPLCESELFYRIEAEISEGKIREFVPSEKDAIACPWHGIEFDVTTGVCLSKKEWKVATYTVFKNSDGYLVVEIPE